MREGRDLWYYILAAGVAAGGEPEVRPAEDPCSFLIPAVPPAGPEGVLHTTGGYLAGVMTHRYVRDVRQADVLGVLRISAG